MGVASGPEPAATCTSSEGLPGARLGYPTSARVIPWSHVVVVDFGGFALLVKQEGRGKVETITVKAV
jgi:hypothetical protein